MLNREVSRDHEGAPQGRKPTLPRPQHQERACSTVRRAATVRERHKDDGQASPARSTSSERR
jgi:hypothetical protein